MITCSQKKGYWWNVSFAVFMHVKVIVTATGCCKAMSRQLNQWTSPKRERLLDHNCLETKCAINSVFGLSKLQVVHKILYRLETFLSCWQFKKSIFCTLHTCHNIKSTCTRIPHKSNTLQVVTYHGVIDASTLLYYITTDLVNLRFSHNLATGRQKEANHSDCCKKKPWPE